MKYTNRIYLIAAAATLLAALAYYMAWVHIDAFKLDVAENEGSVVYSGMVDDLPLATSPVLGEELSQTYKAMTQKEVSETVQAVNFIHQQKLMNMPLWEKNAEKANLDPSKKYIAIVIDDVGVVEDRSVRSVEELPKEVTLAFLPYGESTKKLAVRAREVGHEVMIHQPMQPKANAEGYMIDPGPDALYTHFEIEKIQPIVRENIEFLAPISVGLNNHMGSAFTEWDAGMAEVFNVLEERKLFFLDSITTPKSAAPKAVQNFNIPFLKRDVFLDHFIEADKILEALHKTERVAQRQGYAIAIGHPHDVTTDTILEWSKTLEEKNIQLVPITALLKK